MAGPSSGPTNWFYAVLAALGLVAAGSGYYAFSGARGVLLENGTGASTPASGFVSVYSKTADKGVYAKDATGAETLLGSAGSPTITGSGTANKVSKFTAAGVIGNSSLTDTGSLVTVANPLTVNGTQVASDAAGTGPGKISTIAGSYLTVGDATQTSADSLRISAKGAIYGNAESSPGFTSGSRTASTTAVFVVTSNLSPAGKLQLITGAGTAAYNGLYPSVISTSTSLTYVTGGSATDTPGGTPVITPSKSLLLGYGVPVAGVDQRTPNLASGAFQNDAAVRIYQGATSDTCLSLYSIGQTTSRDLFNIMDGSTGRPLLEFDMGSAAQPRMVMSNSSTGTINTLLDNNGFSLNTGMFVGFSDSGGASAGKTATIYKGAANHLYAGTTGVTGVGSTYINSANCVTLAANYTNATASYTSTNLSRTVAAGLTYAIDVVIHVNQSTAIDGAYFSFAGTASATDFQATCVSTDSAGVVVVSTSTALVTDLGATTFTGRGIIRITGTLTVNAGGTLILQGRQESATAGLLTVYRGTKFECIPSIGL